MKIKRQPHDNIMVLEINGDIMGGSDYDLFTSEIKNLVEEGFVDVVLDLGQVRFINSTGLGIMVSGLTTLKKNTGQLKVCNLNYRIDQIFNITSLSTIFPTYVTCAEALASFEVA
jgi:anti-sigma B factor antagonist